MEESLVGNSVHSETGMESFKYDDRIVRNFGLATTIWGIVGMSVGLLAALQLVWPSFNLTEYFSFGRIRPLHTNAAIFAFVGNIFLIFR